MPSGGGSFGGGGGFSGGGFSGGGGFYSHSYYHGSSYGRGRRSSRKSSPFEMLFWMSCVIVMVVVIIMIALMVNYTKDVNKSADTFYSPGDTRLIEINTLFCSKVTVSESSSVTNAQAYLLTKDEIPPITDRNNFSIVTDFAVERNEFQFWQYHLYPNSNVSISACISQGSSVTLYIIRGTDNYNSWTSDGSSSHAQQNIFISQQCSGSTSPSNTNININREDEWYFAFANTGTGLDQLTVTFVFERFQYTTDSFPNSLSESCSTAVDGDCSLDVGFRSSRRYLLIATSIPSNDVIDWGENVDVDWKCSRNHGGYFLVIGVPIFGLVIVTALVVGVIVLVICIKESNFDIRKSFENFHLPSCLSSSTTTTSNRVHTATSVQQSQVTSTSFRRMEEDTAADDNDVPEEVREQMKLEAEKADTPGSYITQPPPPYPNPPPPYSPENI